MYAWDFNGDGKVDEQSQAPQMNHAFDSACSGAVSVRVVTNSGKSANASAFVTVNALGFAVGFLPRSVKLLTSCSLSVGLAFYLFCMPIAYLQRFS